MGSPITHGAYRQYCGRGGKGEPGHLGNPFWMNDESKRDEVCDQYEEFFNMTIALKGKCGQVSGWDKELKIRGYETYWATKTLYKIAKVQDVELACFCTPKRCHCSTIKTFLEKFL